MSSPPTIINALDAHGNGLRLQLHRANDRVAHTIAAVIEGRVVPLLASVEGSAEDDWPASPPLQQLSVETTSTSERTVALLVGMAGTAHWSASIEPLADRRAFRFDIACRVRGPGEFFGSDYRAMASVLTDDWQRTAALQVSEATCRVIVEPIDENDPTRVRRTEEGLQLVTEIPPETKFPHTLRWRYRVQLATIAGE